MMFNALAAVAAILSKNLQNLVLYIPVVKIAALYSSPQGHHQIVLKIIIKTLNQLLFGHLSFFLQLRILEEKKSLSQEQERF